VHVDHAALARDAHGEGGDPHDPAMIRFGSRYQESIDRGIVTS